MTTISDLILGNHFHSSILYDHKFNINLKSIGFIDFFIQSDFLLPMRQFLKKINTIKKPTVRDL